MEDSAEVGREEVAVGHGVSRWAAWALAATSVVGAVHSVRRARPARFLGVRSPGTQGAQAWTIGTPLSAPPWMLGALVVAAHRDRRGPVRGLSAGFLVGILGEVDTWSTIRRPRSDPVAAACVAAYLVLPTLLIAGTTAPA